MGIWEKKEDGGWDVSDTTFCGFLGDLCELREKAEHVYTTFGVDAYTKGRRLHTSPTLSKDSLAGRASPHMFSCLGLERGWSCTAKSPCVHKRCHLACDRSESTSYLRDCFAELMAKRLAPASFS